MSKDLRSLTLGWVALVIVICVIMVIGAWERNGPPPVDGILTDPWAIVGLLAMAGLVIIPVALALFGKQ